MSIENKTAEKNKSIALFMGDENQVIDLMTGKLVLHSSLYKYHFSWDWLMPVIEKIRKVPSYDRDRFGTTVNITNTYTRIRSESYGSKKEHSKTYFNKRVESENRCDTKENTYKAVVEFINWYNNK